MLSHSAQPPLLLLLTSGISLLSLKIKDILKISERNLSKIGENTFSSPEGAKKLNLHHKTDLANDISKKELVPGL